MKVKKYINQEVNGYLIIDSYVRITPNGKKTRKVLLRCTECGREFERQSGVDFDHIKCKCKCKPEPIHHKKYSWRGDKLSATELCKIYNIPLRTFLSRIERGYEVKEALKNEYTKICPICDKEFTTENRTKKYCSSTCRNRAVHGKGKYKTIRVPCIVCGKEFIADRGNRKTCSRECRLARDRITRKGRYNNLKEQGEFDESVTLINVYNAFKGKCQECGKELSFETGWLENDYPSIDHIKPLAKGGTHTWDNVQLLCRGCNCKKSDK